MGGRLLDKMLKRTGKDAADFRSNSKLGQAMRKRGVPETDELRRVAALPYRRWEDNPDLQFLIESLTEWLRVPDGKQTLRPLQAAGLADVHDFGGLFGPIRVGHGKTLFTRLAPLVLEAKRPLLIVPADLMPKTKWEFDELDEHWQRHPNLEIRSSHFFSLDRNEKWIENYQPDVICIDEVHDFRNYDAGRTRKLHRYLMEHQDTIVLAMSGTITKRSIMDFYHLMQWTHEPETIPMPASRQEVVGWSLALDADVPMNQRMQAGALTIFTPKTPMPDRKQLREGFSDRLLSSPGVIGSLSEEDVDASIYLDFWMPKLSPKLRGAIYRIASERKSLNGDILMEPGDVWRHVRELVCGFYYRWTKKPPEDWLKARTRWFSFVRSVLDQRQRGYDTKLQVANGCRRGDLDSYGAYEEWQRIKDTFKIKTKAVWIDDAPLHEVVTKVPKDPMGTLIWVQHRVVGQRLAEITGFRYFHKKGLCKGVLLESLKGEPAILSIESNKKGRNLQHHWHNNIVVTPPPSGDVWEQFMARTHRPGQNRDVVRFLVMLGHRILEGSMENAFKDAEYQQAMQRAPHKLLLADVTKNFHKAA
jgi:hypothetical protein